ncbi:hypothetical protein Meth11DRAFT_2003 [Methylophilaceae bacterium 11]|nr:hypothetical protein Meth11DRAFT_2003 [Methylophilaceae bacterium 11]
MSISKTIAIHSKHRIKDDLDKLLSDNPKDEKQGVHATLGFTYQQWWATLRIVELLAEPDQFAVGMEFKEDVSIIDDDTTPSKIEFCQIKKNEQAGAWTLEELHKKGRKLNSGQYPPSTLAKLYQRFHDFQPYLNARLRFVSNTGFKIKVNDNSIHSHDFHFKDLTKIPSDLLKKAIGNQLNIPPTSVILKDFSLHRTNLPLNEENIFVAGKLSELNDHSKLPFKILKPTIAARVLASELQSRASNTSYCSTFGELTKTRFMSRSQAIDVLANSTSNKKSLSEILDSAIQILNSDHYPFRLVQGIENVRIQVCVDAVERTNILFINTVKALKLAYAITSSQENLSSLRSLLDETVEIAIQTSPEILEVESRHYINTAALLVIYNAIDLN